MSKLLFVSIATTGLDPCKHDIIKINYSSDIDTKYLRPRKGTLPSSLNKEVLRYNNVTIEELRDYESPSKVAYDFVNFLIEESDNGKNKLCLVSQNFSFDREFLFNFIDLHTDYDYSSYVKHKGIDLMECLPLIEQVSDIEYPNYKFKTLTDYYGITYNSTDMKSKREALVKLYNIFVGNFTNAKPNRHCFGDDISSKDTCDDSEYYIDIIK